MAQFGMQPGGMIKLDDGTLWNPNDPLPSSAAGAFNSTPMGSPLNGLGTMAPRAVAPSPVQAPPAAPGGMFGNSSFGLPQSEQSLPDIQAPPVPAPKPGFNAPGGWGEKLSNVGDILLATSGNPAGQELLQQQTARQQWGRDQAKQGWELQRQMALEAYKQANQPPTEIARNVAYFKQIGRPDLAETYLRAQANPQTLMTNPTTGAVGFYPKGGIAPAAPAGPPPEAVNYLRQNPNLRAQFEAKYGPGSAAQVLGQ